MTCPTRPARIIFYLLLALFFANGVQAAPGGEDLLVACKASLANDFRGIKGALCTWYVTPCDCEAGNAALPKICLTEPVSTATLANAVIEGLRENPALRREEAGLAAATILSRVYPCSE